MSDATSRLLIEDAEISLKRRIASVRGSGDLTEAFVGWILRDSESQYVDLQLAAKTAASRQGAARTYRDVAILGFAVSILPCQEVLGKALQTALEWMSGRKPFSPNRLPDFEVDGLALLGMAQGLICSEHENTHKAREWLSSLLPQSLERGRLESWDRSLILAAQLSFQKGTSQSTLLEPLEPDLAVALAAREIIQVDTQEEKKALALIVTSDHSEQQVDRAATQLAVLDWLKQQVSTALTGRATLAEVVKILEAIPLSLQHWCWEEKPRTRKAGAKAVKWDIQNEYHVQDLLWTILAPVFPDLEDGENLLSLGQKHPKCNLRLPSLRLIIEVKFIYNGNRSEFKEIIESIAADTSLYLPEASNYDKAIAFVWDNSCQTGQHSILRQCIENIKGVIKAIVVPRPQKMNLEQKYNGCNYSELVNDNSEVVHSVKEVKKCKQDNNDMRLTGQQYEQLTKALLEAFPSQVKLAQTLTFRLEKNLNEIAIGDNLKEIIFKLIETAQAEGWVTELVTAARQSNPGNPSLFAFAQEFNLATSTPSGVALEKIIRNANSFLDVNTWRNRLGQIEAQVCRIEITSNKGQLFGTGFLIAPNVAITNYHVMEAVILGEQGLTTKKGLRAARTDVILRFDYKQLANNTIINQGVEYRLAEDWLIDVSPYVIGNQLPQPDELDYALLRVDEVPGREPVGKNAEPGSPERGWIELPTEPHEFLPNSPLFIMQHPKAEPLKLAFDTDAIIGLNPNGTTVTYRTNTEGGSSGSPCFDINWNLVALHHSGDPDWLNPTYNAGTPFSAICSLLEKRALLTSLLSNQPM